MSASSTINFNQENGSKTSNDVCLYALSTCGHCKRAKDFLKENDISFRWVFIDQIEFDKKQEIKQELKEKFEKRVAFPFLVINNEKAIVGFIQTEYEKLL